MPAKRAGQDSTIQERFSRAHRPRDEDAVSASRCAIQAGRIVILKPCEEPILLRFDWQEEFVEKFGEERELPCGTPNSRSFGRFHHFDLVGVQDSLSVVVENAFGIEGAGGGA